jgi:hypothetical protein
MDSSLEGGGGGGKEGRKMGGKSLLLCLAIEVCAQETFSIQYIHFCVCFNCSAAYVLYCSAATTKCQVIFNAFTYTLLSVSTQDQTTATVIF